MSDYTTGRGAHYAMMPGQMSRDTSDDGAFEAAFGLRSG